MSITEKTKLTRKLNPDDLVKTCKCIEGGVWFGIEGVRCCCASTLSSPLIITAEEMNSGNVNYDLIVERRQELFNALNGLNEKSAGACANCRLVKEVKYKDVDCGYLGGHDNIACCFNLAHFSTCNLRCTYCLYTVNNEFVPPPYNNIIDFIEEFKKRDKVLPGNNITYNGGEPTLLKDFEEILNYLLDNNIGNVELFSNSVIYSDIVYNALKENKISLLTSIDAGTPSTYKQLRGADAYHKVIENLTKYKNSGTDRLLLKYNICETNRSDDDLYSFVFTMASIKPKTVILCPDFPYGNKEIPYETVEFGAKMWCLLEKYAGITPYIQTDSITAEPKFVQFSKDIKECYAKLKAEKAFGNECNMNYSCPPVESCKNEDKLEEIPPKERIRFIEKIFSVRNEDEHKIIRILGINVSFKRKKKGTE